MHPTETIRDRLTLQPPMTSKVAGAMDFLRALIISLGEDIEQSLPDCREKALALTKLEELCFWTIAGVARHQEHWSPDLATGGGS